jgi:transposase
MDTDGCVKLLAEEQPVALVLKEATGGLETAEAHVLQAESPHVSVISPRQARDFAWTRGNLAKQDVLTLYCWPRWRRR